MISIKWIVINNPYHFDNLFKMIKFIFKTYSNSRCKSMENELTDLIEYYWVSYSL